MRRLADRSRSALSIGPENLVELWHTHSPGDRQNRSAFNAVKVDGLRASWRAAGKRQLSLADERID